MVIQFICPVRQVGVVGHADTVPGLMASTELDRDSHLSYNGYDVNVEDILWRNCVFHIHFKLLLQVPSH